MLSARAATWPSSGCSWQKPSKLQLQRTPELTRLPEQLSLKLTRSRQLHGASSCCSRSTLLGFCHMCALRARMATAAQLSLRGASMRSRTAASSPCTLPLHLQSACNADSAHMPIFELPSTATQPSYPALCRCMRPIRSTCPNNRRHLRRSKANDPALAVRSRSPHSKVLSMRKAQVRASRDQSCTGDAAACLTRPAERTQI